MPQYNDTLRDMVGSVSMARPGIDPALAARFLNYRMRQLLDLRPYWSGTIGRGVLNIQAAYGIGAATFTQGSNQVVGSGGATWPVSDVVNTTLSSGITNTGYVSATPASMAGITTDTLLYVDAAGPNPEVVPVLEVYPSSFKATFQYPHAPGSTLTCSSYSYLQMHVGYQFPIYTITAVVTPQLLLLDNPWVGVPLIDTGYSIQGIYYTFATDLRDFISVVDPQNATDLQLHYPRAQLDWDDPQRSATDWPQYVCDYSENLNGNMQWELYPNPTSTRQLYFTYIKQVPDMKAPTDRPISFIDPSILVMGALADSFRVRVQGSDPRGDLQISQMWEMRYREAAMNAASADNGKAQQAYSWAKGGGGVAGGANFWQSHDIDVQLGSY